MKGQLANQGSGQKNGHRRTNSRYGGSPGAEENTRPIGKKLADSDESAKSNFKTDSDISGSYLQLKERELQRWVPDEDAPANPTLTLDEDTFGYSGANNYKSGGQWDQFKVNEEKFGVEASYDEHLYTTRIDTTASDYKEKLAKADRLAKEIEGQATSDRHILEERGQFVDDSGMDEEDKYSGVDRRGDELMAALRNASITNENNPAAVRAPGSYVPPRQRAAQHHNDPAIISSSAATKSKGSPGPESAEQLKTAKAAPSKAATSVKGPATSAKGPPAKPDSVPAKPQVPAQHNESFRLNAQSEINSLREFSANFKIPHEIPTDLLPILSKDKLKQDEILSKQQEQHRLKQKKEQQQAQEQQAAAPKKKPEAKTAFKLNPKAMAFTPSKHIPLSPTPPKTNFHRSPNNSSPRMKNSRPYSGSGNSGTGSNGSRRHHQISPADFFGGVNRIPTKESQEKKLKDFKFAFNLFVTARKKHNESNAKTPMVYEKTFKTPPTWDSNFDDTHDKLFPSAHLFNKAPGMMMSNSQFIPSPLMGSPNIPTGYPTPNGSKFPISPHQQQAAVAAAMAAQFQHQQQQQQFHAAMLYQQQFPGAVPPGQPPMPIYPGGEPQFLPPGGFMPPPGTFVPGGSPVNGNMIMGGGSPYGQNHQNYNHNPGNGRRYNNNQGGSKRGGHS